MTLLRPEDYIGLGKISYDYFLEKSFILGTELEFKACQKWSKAYIFDRERSNYDDWFGIAIYHCRPTIIILIIKILLEEKKKRKDVLEDLKIIVNKTFILLDLCDNLNKIFTDESELNPETIVCYTPEIFSELFKYLLYLGAIYNKEAFSLFLDDEFFIKFRKGIFKAIDKYEAGLKIVEAVENALDDELYLTKLRAKIDLRKFLDLMEEESSIKLKEI